MFGWLKSLFGFADANSDGKVDLNDVKYVADVNKDGVVNTEDVKEAGKKVKKATKQVVNKTARSVARATNDKKLGRPKKEKVKVEEPVLDDTVITTEVVKKKGGRPKKNS